MAAHLMHDRVSCLFGTRQHCFYMRELYNTLFTGIKEVQISRVFLSFPFERQVLWYWWVSSRLGRCLVSDREGSPSFMTSSQPHLFLFFFVFNYTQSINQSVPLVCWRVAHEYTSDMHPNDKENFMIAFHVVLHYKRMSDWEKRTEIKTQVAKFTCDIMEACPLSKVTFHQSPKSFQRSHFTNYLPPSYWLCKCKWMLQRADTTFPHSPHYKAYICCSNAFSRK